MAYKEIPRNVFIHSNKHKVPVITSCQAYKAAYRQASWACFGRITVAGNYITSDNRSKAVVLILSDSRFGTVDSMKLILPLYLQKYQGYHETDCCGHESRPS